MANRKSIIAVIILFIFVAGYCFATDYEIINVIEVGPAHRMPMAQPLKWSPDGKNLSYFFERTLYLADTLGNTRPLRDFKKYIHRYEWLSDSEICLLLEDGKHLDSSVHQMAVYNIETDELSILEEYVSYRRYGVSGTLYFIGPYKTIEGLVYYNKTESVNDPTINYQKDSYPIVGKYDNFDQIDAHIFRWGNGGLYRIDIVHSDSILFYSLPAHHFRGGALINLSKTHLLHGAVLIDISNKSLLTLPKEEFADIKDADDCGFDYLSFSPNDREILFHISCDNFKREETVAFRIGTYNYQTNTLTLLSPFNDERDCMTPIYHPDGKKIAFLSENKVYIIYRKILENE